MENNKKWPGWVKGGIIGLIFGLIGYFFKHTLIVSLLWGFLPSRFLDLFLLHKAGTNVSLFFSVSIAPIFYLVVGVLIGWVVEKIKSRNN